MMQYIITEYQNMGRGQIHLCLNETITLRLYKGEANQMSLAQGVELSEEQYRYLLHDIIGKRAAKRAMHLLERQERTEYQLREKLRQNCYPPEAIEDAVDYVKRYHYLDDERYARTFIHFHQETRSKMRLKNDLARRGISRELIAWKKNLCRMRGRRSNVYWIRKIFRRIRRTEKNTERCTGF